MGLFGLGKKKTEPEAAVEKVGIGQKIDQSVRNFGREKAMGGVQHKVSQLVQEGRLVFVKDERLEYTNKKGVKTTLSFGGMADILVEASGFDNLVQLGITPNDVKAVINEKYEEVKGGKQVGT